VFSGTEDKYASENASVEQWKKTLDVDLTVRKDYSHMLLLLPSQML